MYELTQMLFTTWRRGGAWDEARPEREVLRVAEGSRDASPIGALREMVIDALQDLGEGRWVPWHSLEGYLADDERIAGIERLLRRWSERAGVEPPDVLATTRRIALETLPALGIIDLGGVVHDGARPPRRRPWAARAPAAPRHLPGTTCASPRAAARCSPAARPPSTRRRASSSTRTRSASASRPRSPTSSRFAQFAELGRVGDQLDVLLTAQAIARALSAGVESDSLRARIELVAPLPDTISRMLIQASAVIGRGSLVQASGFLWVDDAEVRELLRTRRPASELFVDPSPPGGLLIYPDVDIERVVRRCRALGVEVEVEAGVARVRTHTTPPPGRVAAASASAAASRAAPRRPRWAARRRRRQVRRPRRLRPYRLPRPRPRAPTPAEGLKRTKR